MVKDIKPKKSTEGPVDGDYPEDEKNMSAFQITERRGRTCFVGNLPLSVNAKKLR